MLDILLKQMELQDIDKHTGLNSQLCSDVCWLLKCMLSSKLIGNHNCSFKSECGYCESSVMWHQLSLQLIKYLSPIYPAHPPDVNQINCLKFTFEKKNTYITFSHLWKIYGRIRIVERVHLIVKKRNRKRKFRTCQFQTFTLLVEF